MQDLQLINVLKGLVIDGVDKAQSGHPGGPRSSMDLAYVLFTEYLRFDPEDPEWLGRDRFILSAGHMSMLQYVMLYGIGWLGLDDLKAFRQLHSRTPGHPENFMTPGVECTTGPLGQGAAMSVGFATAASHLGAVLDERLFAHKTWVIVSDGDLQEGVATDAASLAGHLRLGNLVWIYDRNHVQLSGPTRKAVSTDDETLFKGLGWNVITIDGHDHAAIRNAYDAALSETSRPTIVIADTIIGKGAYSMEDSFKTHGSPLPADERLKTKVKLGLPESEAFYVPAGALERFRRNFAKRSAEAKAWREAMQTKLDGDQAFAKAYKAHFGEHDYAKLPKAEWKDKAVATRNAFGDVLKTWAEALPPLMGGSADLEPSVMTGPFAKVVGDFDSENRKGRNINFGVREFAMSAMCNGMALHGGIIPFDATFLSFADYSRAALRLGSLQRVRVIHEFTHDSFYLGEDGPTHQPVEQVMSLRLIPDLYVMRPGDAIETEVLMRKALALTQPSIFALSRQKLPVLADVPRATLEQAVKGAYILKDDGGTPDLILIATGSELSLAVEVAGRLKGQKVRVVSMPCWELFKDQSEAYKASVLPPAVKCRVSIEAGVTLGWERFVGERGLTIGIDHFGASAPAEVLAKEYGFTAEAVEKRIASHTF
jgi:transketolase